MAQIVQAGGIVLRRTAKGDVEEGKLLREAALREVAEETGLRCRQNRLSLGR